MRGRGLGRFVLLGAILGWGLLLAAHAPLHDYDLAAEHGDGHGHQPTGHQHPVRTLAIAVLAAVMIVVGFVVARSARGPAASRRALSVAFRRPARCDDDVGIHDLLSVYRI